MRRPPKPSSGHFLRFSHYPIHSLNPVSVVFALGLMAQIQAPGDKAQASLSDSLASDSALVEWASPEWRASADTLTAPAPFPEALDTSLLHFPYRPEFLSPAWDSVAKAVAAQAAAAAAKALAGPASKGMVPVAGLPGALNRPVRVLLKREGGSAGLNLQGDFGLSKLDGVQAIPQALVLHGKVSMRPKGRDWEITDAAGTRTLRDCRGVKLFAARYGAFFEVEGIPYRGILEILAEPASTQLLLVNVLPMEDYLRGVLPYELGKVDAQTVEALKALAVGARTYALKRMMRPGSSRFDLYSDVQDQVYKGMKDEYALSDGAIRDTRGQVLLHADTLAQTFYHSTCGGRTANRSDVWEGPSIPYLVSREDKDAQGRAWCAASPLMNWEQTWSEGELADILKRNFKAGRAQGEADFDRLKAFEVTERSVCGRIKTLRIATDEGDVLLKGDRVRWALKPLRKDGRILESANFEITLKGKGVMALGSGFGHGVGLCQYGAMGRARAGQSYRAILLAYFAGTQVVEYR